MRRQDCNAEDEVGVRDELDGGVGVERRHADGEAEGKVRVLGVGHPEPVDLPPSVGVQVDAAARVKVVGGGGEQEPKAVYAGGDGVGRRVEGVRGRGVVAPGAAELRVVRAVGSAGVAA